VARKRIHLRGEARRHRRDAERLVAQVEADRRPVQHATVTMLLDRWVQVVGHELSTATTTAGCSRRMLKSALGDWQLRCRTSS
jgi:hypothetical protein